jgi:enoyl-CoA hydratase
VLDEGRVRWVTIERPQRLNALNSQVLAELREAVEAAAADPALGAIVLRGSGERAFCAGADLGEIDGLDAEQAHAFIRHGHRTMSAVAGARIPVIAAVDGFALGGGLELMLACHLVVASERSQFGLPEANIGAIPGFGGTQRLFTTVGKAAAFHLLLTGERIDAHRAWQIGLLSIPPLAHADLEATVSALATKVSAGSRSGMASILEAAGQGAAAAALEHEAALAGLAIASADGQEGIRAFAERRTPHFKRES